MALFDCVTHGPLWGHCRPGTKRSRIQFLLPPISSKETTALGNTISNVGGILAIAALQRPIAGLLINREPKELIPF